MKYCECFLSSPKTREDENRRAVGTMLNPMRDKNEAMIVFGGGEKTPASRAMVELVQNSAPVSRADGKNSHYNG